MDNSLKDWFTILIQLPIVAVFIWYSLRLQERFLTSMENRDKEFLEALNKVSSVLQSHDERLSRFIDQTRGRG